jgi:hypothetical protein
MDGRSFAKFGVDGVPACGTPDETLAAHGLDAASLASSIAATVKGVGPGK